MAREFPLAVRLLANCYTPFTFTFTFTLTQFALMLGWQKLSFLILGF